MHEPLLLEKLISLWQAPCRHRISTPVSRSKRVVVEKALQRFDHDFDAVVPFERVLHLDEILVHHVQPTGEQPAYRVADAGRRFKERDGIRDDAERAWSDGADSRRVRGFEQGGHFSEDNTAIRGRGDGYPVPEDFDRSLHEEEKAAGLVALADNILPGSKFFELPAVKQFHEVRHDGATLSTRKMARKLRIAGRE